ncbi:stage V sporulation protein K [Rhypophila sp. PSN 637]
MTASSQADTQRAGRLRGLFRAMISGDRLVRSSKDAELFFEAVRLNASPTTCFESIIAGKQGLNVVRASVRVNLEPQFILTHTLPFLQCMSDPAIKSLGDGQLLHMFLAAIVDPPTLWNTLVTMANGNQIKGDNLLSLAWLALEIVLLPSGMGINLLSDVETISNRGILHEVTEHPIRELGYRIKNALQLGRSPDPEHGASAPGGRHDNDHVNFHDISIYPTTDEFLSTEQPYFRTAEEVFKADAASRPGLHLDNQFRLLREDMLAELREDLQVAIGAKKAKRAPDWLGGLEPIGLDVGDQKRYRTCTLRLKCLKGLKFLHDLHSEARKKFLMDNANCFKHQSFGVMLNGKEILGFAFIDRDIDLLAMSPPVVCLQFTDDQGLRKALMGLKLQRPDDLRFVLVGTPVFAYEPVLKALKEIKQLPLHQILVDPAAPENDLTTSLDPRLQRCVEELDQAADRLGPDGAVALPMSSPQVRVDGSQLDSITLALKKAIAIIQGPPGTGKSFTGAHIAKTFHRAGMRLLVISYTNHALNQFTEDLLDVGIPADAVIRVGGSKAKCTPRTQSLLLSEQRGGHRRSFEARSIIETMKLEAEAASDDLNKAFQSYLNASITWNEVSEYLEFSDERFYQAFRLPSGDDADDPGWKQAGKDGKEVQPNYLYQRWIRGDNPGIFSREIPATSHFVWNMNQAEREQQLHEWQVAILGETVASVAGHADNFNKIQDKIDIQFKEADRNTLLQKTVITCTTTGAAIYSRLIRAAQPDVIIVEEAGEILESHILTALASTVKQVVLIGDHKQLRPKINNYMLSVEKGNGFDLNCSLFERMILQGAAHTTLQKQHRMAREISRFPRALTYPDLLDGPKTENRPLIRGLQDRVIFVNHGRQEESDKSLKDRRDPTVKESKKNLFEVEMVLSCVKYLGQQGYSNSQIVVLAPYLGQIRVLQDLFQANKQDPELSEMDNRELLRAGLISQAAARVNQKPLRLSTVDNYQGEESEIVIVSLTRSNGEGDIGFMYAPERLNVLITRARNCLILIGNMQTFLSSKRGAATWQPFFELLKTHGHLYDGLPIRCEKHPEKTALVKQPIDLTKACPDGGCTDPCNATLRCGIHKCKSRCHRITDHSKAECREILERLCNRKHKTRITCSRRKEGCDECFKEDKEQERRIRKNLEMEEERVRRQQSYERQLQENEERRIRRDLKLEEDRLQRQEEYKRQLQDIEDKIDLQRRVLKYQAEAEDEKTTLKRREEELRALEKSLKNMQKQKQQQAEAKARAAQKALERQAKAARGQATDSSDCVDSNSARAEWEHLKTSEGAASKPMDELMIMIGLEDVKQSFLSIKSKIDTAVRQGISLSKERFGCCMLGNPGTGKTTVARLYAQFLTQVGVIPGDCFKETTGSGLTNLGVSGCKKLIDEILANNGGVLFIDEAYQLTSGNSPGGGAVLDYLLAEVENLTGKVVFVLAGYNKQMEGLLAHNPGIPSRFPIEMKFADYTDEELLQILELKINNKYNGAVDCEDGLQGLYCRIISRRIGRGRGKEGFGNARTVENTLAIISKRQADRLRRERRSSSKKTNDWLLTKEDLIGPEPSEALSKCQAWGKLQALTGLGAVKEAVRSLVDSIQQNYKREISEQPPILYSLNKVFLGSPGTGKTTVAKLYGEILVTFGLLSKGEVVVKNPSDFVGAALGQSEQQTKGILAAAVGKVLVIDEAYGLYGGGNSQGSTSDPYKTAVIDTIVAEVQSVPGDDRCVLLLGYKDQMETMFQNVNPGLQRRFPTSSAFHFDDFSDDEMRIIFDKKVKEQGYRVTDQAAGVVMEMLKRARNRTNFGNAGEIDILLDSAKARHQSRYSKGLAKSDALLEAKDFDEDFDRAERSETNVKKLFEGTVGQEQTILLLQGFQETVRTFKGLAMDPKENIPFNFLFRGPPGTGKTTTAKKMGKVFYDMGFLATAEVVECSATDLIGMYVGHTGPKVQQLLDKALGRVLFVDEAYRLAEGHFAKEAMDEIVDSVTKEKYYKKLIIILAGYEADINRLMSVNPGLTSRFPTVVDFRPLNSEECIALLLQLLQRQKAQIRSKGKDIDLTCLEKPTNLFQNSMMHQFTRVSVQENWASARDVQSIAKDVFNSLLRCKEELSEGCLVLKESSILGVLQSMLSERQSRAKSTASASIASQVHEALRTQLVDPPVQTPTTTTTESRTILEKNEDVEPVPDKAVDAEKETERVDASELTGMGKRDAGVSDAVWEQLLRDRKAEQEKEEEYQKLKEESKKASGAARNKIVKRLIEEERQRKLEEEKKKKLMMMGQCPVGYAWIKQASGYRCAGGSHYMSDKDVERL